MNICDISNNLNTVCVTLISDSSGESSPTLKVCRHGLKPSKTAFESSDQRDISLNIAHKLDSVKLHVADNNNAVLVKCRDESQDTTKLICCHWKTSGNPVVDDLLSCRSPGELSNPLQIKDSLYCVLSKNTVIFLDVSKPATVGRIGANGGVHSILSVCCVEDSFFLLLLCQSPEDKTRHLKLLVVDKTFNLSDEQVDVNDIIPSLYGEVVTCAVVLIHQNFGECQKVPLSSAWVCTNRKQLVCFRDGRISRCLPLPFDDAKKMQLFVAPSFQKIIIIENDRKSLVCIDEQTCKVLKSFEAIQACLVDDFLCSGSEQLLIIFDQSLSSFVLLDFEAVHIDKTFKDSTQSKEPENVRNEQFTQVLSALSHRLQIGRASLVQSEACVKEKEALIERACQNIEKMALGKSSGTVQSDNLVPLLPLNSQPSVQAMYKLSDRSSVVQVLSSWKRLLFNKIVIGVKLKNSTDEPFLQPSLLVCSTAPHDNTSNAMCISKTFVQSLSVPGAEDIPGVPLPKRPKPREDLYPEFHTVDSVEPGQNFYVAGMVPASDVALWNKLDVTLSLLWHSEKEASGEEDRGDTRRRKQKTKNPAETARSREKENGRVVVIGHDRILVKELTQVELSCCKPEKPELIECDTFRELLCLHTVQLLSELLVTCTVSSVSAVRKMLLDDFGFHQFEAFQCLICCENRGLFYHTRVKLDVKERCKGKLQIWTRDVAQLMLLLRVIYSHSPDDLLILPANQNACNITPAIKALHREMSLVNDSLQKMVNTTADEQGEEGTEIAMETDGELSEAQRTFKAEQSRVLQNKRKTVQPSLNWEEVKNAIVQSDAAMLKISGPS